MDYRIGRAHLALCTMFGTAVCASTGALAADLSMPNIPEDQEAVTVLPDGSIRLGAIKLKFGGFSEFATFWRSRNETADIGSSFGGIPFGNSPLAHEHETRFSARQSRISALATGDLDQYTHLSMYVESDFLGAGTTSNSNESNSYTPRIRHFYGTYDNDLTGWHVLAGQTWSLLTTNTAGIKARNEDIPLTIDAQYVVGFNWTRNPQFRVVKDLTPWMTAGFSVESPAAQIAKPIPGGTNANNPGGSLLNSDTSYSNDIMPDVVGKVAFDPGWGHYEIKGIVRGFTDRSNHSNSTIIGGGGGASASLPIIPKALELQASVLAGNGIGRYGSGQQPDVTFDRDGNFATIPSVQLLTGLVAHPGNGSTVYAYGGLEQLYKKVDGGVGYGLDNVDNSGCDIEGGICNAQTKRLWEVTGGVWQDIYKGSFGRAAVGAQAEYIKREAFNSDNGGAPTTDDMVVLGSFRYYPFK